MFRSFTSAMARHLGIKIASPVRSSVIVRTGNKFRPHLEALDGRIVPAVNTFLGGPSFDAASWSAGRYPTYGDDVVFDGGYTSDPCTLSAIGPLGSLRLVNGYSGTVTLGNMTYLTGAFEMTGGAVAMAQSWSNLHVNGLFTWSGGTLNSNPNATTVYVNGGGSIAPLNAGTVLLGSTLAFNGTHSAPKETTITPGTIALTAGGGGLLVGAYATVTARTSTQGDIIGITKNVAGAQAIDITQNAVLNCIGPGQVSYDLYIRNQGSLNLTGSVRVNLTGLATAPLGAIPVNYGQTATGGLGIENGSLLSASDGLNITGGILYLTMNTSLMASQQAATINGTVYMSGGTILFAAPIGIGSTPFVYGTFTVNGDVIWSGGTYKPSIDYTTVGLANKWFVNGKMNSAATCTIEPNPQRGSTPPASSNWSILEATSTAGALPTVSAGSSLNITQGTSGDRKVWSLLSPPPS